MQERGLNFATQVGPEVSDGARVARSRREAARRRRVVDALRQGRVRLHGVFLVPAIAGGSARGVSPVRESTEREITPRCFSPIAVQSKLRTRERVGGAAISRRRSGSLISVATPAANASAVSATQTLWPCSRPSPAHPEVVEMTARSHRHRLQHLDVGSRRDRGRDQHQVALHIQRPHVGDETQQTDARIRRAAPANRRKPRQ